MANSVHRADRRKVGLAATTAGTSIGLLLGILLGLSGAPVVAGVVGGVLAAAAAYWSVAEQREMPEEPSSTNPLTSRQLATAALCLACIIGLSAGLWLRARDVFAISPREQVQQWLDAGFSASDAQAIVALRNAGLLKPGYSVQPEAVSAARSTVLFSGSAAQCQQLDPQDFADAANLRAAYENAGGSWRGVATAVRQLAPDVQYDVLKAAWTLACR
jgi:hypothetical protein